MFENHSPEPSEDKMSPTMLGRLSEKGTYSGLIKVPNNVTGVPEY